MCEPPAGGFFVSEKRGISEASFLFCFGPFPSRCTQVEKSDTQLAYGATHIHGKV